MGENEIAKTDNYKYLGVVVDDIIQLEAAHKSFMQKNVKRVWCS